MLNLLNGVGTTPNNKNIIETPQATFTPTITTEPDALRIHQRSTTNGGGENKGTGSVRYTIDLPEQSNLYVRVRSADGNNTILQNPWLAITDAPAGDSERLISGIDAHLGWFYLDFAGSPSGPWASGTNEIGMGRIVALAGQSLAVRMFARLLTDQETITSMGITPNANGSIFATYTSSGFGTVTTPAWALPATGTDYDGVFAAEFLRLQVEASGMNCALTGHARGSMSITQFIPGGSENQELRDVLDAAGGFEEFLWFQGHSDSAAGMAKATYKGHLDTLFTDIDAHNDVFGAAYNKVLATIPNKSATSLRMGKTRRNA